MKFPHEFIFIILFGFGLLGLRDFNLIFVGGEQISFKFDVA